MEIVYEEAALNKYMEKAVLATGDNPILIDKFPSKAIEIDVDCIADNENVYIAGIMDHIEEAGIHSGESAGSLPPQSLSASLLKEVERQLSIDNNIIRYLTVKYDELDLKNEYFGSKK